MANQPIRLSQKVVSALPLPESKSGRVSYRDSEVAGLSVQVSHTGVKAFYWYGRVRKQPTRICLGRFPEVAVEAARVSAKAIMGDVAEGKLPVSKRRAVAVELTLGQAFSGFLNGYSKAHKRTWKTDEKRFNRVLAQWRHRGLSQLTRGEITQHHVHLGESSGVYAANKMLELLTSVYRYACETMGWDGKSPVKGIVKFDVHERERFLSEDELSRFLAALPTVRKQVARDLFLLCLLTGGRRSNVSAMRWDEIDWDRQVWRIPPEKSKSKRSMSIPLTESAVAALREIQGRNNRQWVLPSHSATGHYVWPRESWRRLLKAAKITDLRLHDLRRTFGSYQAMAGASMLIIAKSLGQFSTASTGVYARLQMDPVRESLEKATEKMLGTAQKKTYD